MKYLSRPFKNEKNQVIFLSLALFWVSNIYPLLSGKTFLLRILVYPFYLILLFIFTYLFFVIKEKKKLMNNTGYVLFLFLIILGCICILRGISPHMTKDELRSLLFGLSISWLMPVALIYGIKKQFWFDWLPRIRIIVVIGGIYVLAALLIGIATGHTAEGRMHHSADFLLSDP